MAAKVRNKSSLVSVEKHRKGNGAYLPLANDLPADEELAAPGLHGRFGAARCLSRLTQRQGLASIERDEDFELRRDEAALQLEPAAGKQRREAG
jgi:hypothetical protein